MPAFHFSQQQLYLGRFVEFGFEIWRWDETADEGAGAWKPVAIDEGTDVLYAKLSATRGGPPVLDLASNAALTGGSKIYIEDPGSIDNIDPLDDSPATGRVEFCEDDTATLADAWPATTRQRRYWLDLSLDDNADGHLKTFGRGAMLVERSPAGLGVGP